MATFPTTPLPITVGLAPGANPADASTFQFTDITSDVRYSTAVAITAGRQSETAKVDATGHALTLGNSSGNYSRRNPNGLWYGQLRTGTPIQTKVTLIDDLFARTTSGGLGTEPTSGFAWTSNSTFSTNGTNGQCAITTANTAFSTQLPSVVSDDVRIYKVTSLSAVTTGASWVDACQVRYQDGNNFFYVHTEYSTSGVISVKIVQNDKGTQTTIYNIAATSVAYSAGTKIASIVEAVGPTIRIKVWLASSAEPLAWTASVNVVSSTVRGNAVGLYQWRVSGNTNSGTLTLSIYEFRVDSIRASTPVPEWSPRWNVPQTNITTPITGAGILRRLSSGQAAVRSPMYRQITGYTDLVGYWPIEDGTQSTQLTNALAGGQPGTVSNMTLGANGPFGSASAGTFTNSDSSSQIGGQFVSASSTAGWQVSWCAQLSSAPSALTQEITWWTTTGDRWAVNLNTGVYNLHIIDKDGNLLFDSNITNVGAGDPTQWIAFRIKGTISGGTVSVEFAWYAQGATTLYGTTGSYSNSTIGALRNWSATGNASMQNGQICQVFGVTGTADNLQSYAALRAFDGYAGETAGARVVRLAAQEAIPCMVMGDPAATAPMGPQATDTFLNLVREAEDAEQGLLVERGAALGFLTYRFRTNVTVSAALDMGAPGHIAAPPEPTDDDLNLFNTVNLSRKNGAQVIAVNAASVLLSGTYETDVTVNVQTDGQLRDQAGWRLHMGTIDEMRWPQLSLSLHATPALISVWCGLRIGSRITVANPPAALAGAPLDLIIEGYTETITPLTWDVVINCSPAHAWDTGIWGTTRYNAATSTLVGTQNTTSVSWNITTVLPQEVWSTTSLPYDWTVGGERVTVTAMTAASGSGPYTQTATVTRSVNGIVKSHVANEQISLTDNRVYSI